MKTFGAALAGIAGRFSLQSIGSQALSNCESACLLSERSESCRGEVSTHVSPAAAILRHLITNTPSLALGLAVSVVNESIVQRAEGLFAFIGELGSCFLGHKTRHAPLGITYKHRQQSYRSERLERRVMFSSTTSTAPGVFATVFDLDLKLTFGDPNPNNPLETDPQQSIASYHEVGPPTDDGDIQLDYETDYPYGNTYHSAPFTHIRMIFDTTTPPLGPTSGSMNDFEISVDIFLPPSPGVIVAPDFDQNGSAPGVYDLPAQSPGADPGTIAYLFISIYDVATQTFLTDQYPEDSIVDPRETSPGSPGGAASTYGEVTITDVDTLAEPNVAITAAGSFDVQTGCFVDNPVPNTGGSFLMSASGAFDYEYGFPNLNATIGPVPDSVPINGTIRLPTEISNDGRANGGNSDPIEYVLSPSPEFVDGGASGYGVDPTPGMDFLLGNYPTSFELAPGDSTTLTPEFSLESATPLDPTPADATLVPGIYYVHAFQNYNNPFNDVTYANWSNDAVSAPIKIVGNTLAFAHDITDTTIGQAYLSPAIEVDVLDPEGNVDSTDNSDVTLSINSGPGGATLGGDFTVQAQSGVATFDNITLDKPGLYSLTATDGTDQSAESNEFTVTTLLTLASLSQDVYNSSPNGYDGYDLLDVDTASNNKGYLAAAYISANDTQIIIAVRGTYLSLSSPIATLKNLLADLSFGSAPTAYLASEVSDVDAFVRDTAAENPDAQITLTGHSLGGAVAQLVGQSEGLPAYVFDAPGAAQLSKSPSSVAPSFNYRLAGDQISLFGSPIGQTITVSQPLDVTLPARVTGFAAEVSDFVSNCGFYIGTCHDIGNLVQQIGMIGNGATTTYGVPDYEPNDAEALNQFVQPSKTFVPTVGGVLNLVLAFEVDSSTLAAIIDPSNGSDFVLSEQQGSPNVQSIELPPLPDVASYAVRSETGGTWSTFQTVQPGEQAALGPNVEGVEFRPVDSTGGPVLLADSFLFGTTFDSSGAFNGLLSENDAAPGGSEAISPQLSSSANTAVAGEAVTFTATVAAPTSGGTPPTGTVTFRNADGGTLGTSEVKANGVAIFSTTFNDAGIDTVTAFYSGDDTFAPASSTPLDEMIAASRSTSATISLGSAKPPSSIIAGESMDTQISLVVGNTGQKLDGLYTVRLYAERAGGADGSEVPLGTIQKRLALTQRRSTSLAIYLKSLPASLATGDYTFLAELSDPAGGRTWATSNQSFNVLAPSIQPVLAITPTFPTTLKSGQTVFATIDVTNLGNTTASSLSLSLSPISTVGATLDTPLVTVSKSVYIKPGATLKLRLRIRPPKSLVKGQYLLLVSTVLNGSGTSIVGPQPFSVE